MRLLPLTTLILLAAAAGCRSYPKAAPVEERVEAVSPENAEALRASYAQHYPGSQLGVVAAARPTDRLVAIGGVALDQMAVGQLVTFIDSKQHPLANGTIVRILPDSVHGIYEPVAGGREPRVGDMMLRLP